jgi:hypothetical protein
MGKTVFPPCRSVSDFGQHASAVIFTDACEKGMGAWFPSLNQFLSGPWSREEWALSRRQGGGRTRSMPYFEFRAIALSVTTWREELRNQTVLIRTDCETAQEVLLSGRSRDPATMDRLRSLVLVVFGEYSTVLLIKPEKFGRDQESQSRYLPQ